MGCVRGVKEAGCPIDRRALRFAPRPPRWHCELAGPVHAGSLLPAVLPIIWLIRRHAACHSRRHRHPASVLHSRLLHLVQKTTHPTVGHRGHDHARRQPTRMHRVAKLTPARVVPAQPLGRLDQHALELRVARLHQPAVGHTLAAGGVPRRHRAEPRQLLAGGLLLFRRRRCA